MLTTADSAKANWRRSRRETCQRLWSPRPRLTVSEWADQYRVLSPESSAEPGAWKTDRAPYQRAIMDAFSDPEVERVVGMTSSQIGKTEILNNVVGYFIDQDPAPILVVQPNVEPMAKAWSQERLGPMIRDTPRLRGRVREAKSRDPGNTVLHKMFAGGHITVVGANAPSGLASRPIRIALFDEVDRYPESSGQEGDPIKIGSQRTATFWNRKIGEFSTPTLKGISRIEASFLAGNQQHRHVPCPLCGFMQILTWGQLTWEEGQPGTAKYACSGCGVLIPEYEKAKMDKAGQWIASKPEIRRVASFHLNALMSPWTRWEELATEFLEAQIQPSTLLQPFINLKLGESWEQQGGVAKDTLAARREPYAAPAPAGVQIITMGVDVQATRIEATIWGWGIGDECWLLGYHIIEGDPTGSQVWKDLDNLRRTPLRHESGHHLKIAATGIDSGHETQSVYTYCRTRFSERVFCMKGSSVAGAPLLPRKASRNNKARVRVFLIGTDAAKDLWYGRLRQTKPGPGYVHFSRDATIEFFDGLTSERRIRKLVKGRWVSRFESRQGVRNEPLDTAVYGLAAYRLLGTAAQRLESAVEEQPAAVPSEEQAPISAPPAATSSDVRVETVTIKPGPQFRPGHGIRR